MSDATLEWGAPSWGPAALVLFGVGAIALAWGYWRAPTSPLVSGVCASLKAIALAALALCLLEPLWRGTRPKSGENILAVVADNSRSMTISDTGATGKRGEQLEELLQPGTSWQRRLEEVFKSSRFLFDSHVRPVEQFSTLPLDGDRTSLHAALGALGGRFRGLPLAGVLLFSDGNATDVADVPWDELPPIYPIVIGSDDAPPDLSVPRVSVSQTNFETAPVVIRADVEGSGFAGQKIIAKLFDEEGEEVEQQVVERGESGEPLAARFQLRPEKLGVSFYRVQVALEEEEAPKPPIEDSEEKVEAGGESPEIALASEATLANNERIVVVDRGGGPYRVLYVCGRPNWDYKFLRRALEEDEQLELIGLVRMARRQPKFSFRSSFDQDTNLIFKNFDNVDEDDVESYDQPVLLRLGTEDERELRNGFPTSADLLYRYDAVILDDVEAEFFKEDQLLLLEKFVGRRGGGLLMMGGLESFARGGYERTPVARMLPVYLTGPSRTDPSQKAGDDSLWPDGPSAMGPSDAAGPLYRLSLTRDGWLEPWVRLRQTEQEERSRLAEMSPFMALSEGRQKPGASVLAEVLDESGGAHPALVAQRFVDGRSAALMVADVWRWGMKRPEPEKNDLEKAWRQMVRWLVADVPQRVEVDVSAVGESVLGASSETGAVSVLVRVRDPEFMPLENAQVTVEVTAPDGKTATPFAEPSEMAAGAYVARYVPREQGAYRAKVTVTAPDGSPIGQREAGWVTQPAADEFRSLRPNRALLEEIASETGGEIVASENLDEFVASLPSRKVPRQEPWERPLWHDPLFYVLVMGCFAAEWGLRRWKGLA